MNEHIPVSYALCDHEGNTRSRVQDDATQLINHFIEDLMAMRKKVVLETSGNMALS